MPAIENPLSDGVLARDACPSLCSESKSREPPPRRDCAPRGSGRWCVVEPADREGAPLAVTPVVGVTASCSTGRGGVGGPGYGRLSASAAVVAAAVVPSGTWLGSSWPLIVSPTGAPPAPGSAPGRLSVGAVAGS